MFEQATQIIEERLRDNWVETPIDYDNVEYNPIRGTAFVRLQIEWTSTNLTSITGRAKGEGYIDLSIFVETNTGSIAVNAFADSLSLLYNRFMSGRLICGAARTVRVGEQDNWYQLKVQIPFTYDECYNLPT